MAVAIYSRKLALTERPAAVRAMQLTVWGPAGTEDTEGRWQVYAQCPPV